MKDGRDFVSRAGLLQQFEQVVVRIEQAQMTLLARTGMRRAATLGAKDFKTSAGQLIAQMNAKFPGGEIGQATHLVNRFETGAAGNNDFHGFQITTACFIRRTSACNSRASCLRSALPSRKWLKSTDA